MGSASRSSPARRSARPFAAQQQALVDAETVLLVDHRQRRGRGKRPRSWNSAWVPTTIGIDPSASAAQQSCPFACPSPPPVSSATGTGAKPRQRAMVLLRQHLGRRHQRRLRARPPPRAACASSATSVLPEPTSPCSSRSIRRGAARSASISASARRCEAVSGWPKRGQRLGAQAAIARPAPVPAARAPGRAPPPARPGRPAVRHRPAGCAMRGRRAGSAGACTARSASANPGQLSRRSSAGSCHSGRSGSQCQRARHRRRPPAAATGRRSAARPARSPAAAPAGRPAPRGRGAAWSAGRRTVRSCRRPAASRPAASARSRVNLKNTSSAKPVPSVTTTFQGWRQLAGGSWRTTSTASVDHLARACASAIVGRARRSRYDSGRWNSRSITRSPPTTRASSGASAGPMPRSAGQGREKRCERIGFHG